MMYAFFVVIFSGAFFFGVRIGWQARSKKVLLPSQLQPYRVECAWCRAVLRNGREPVSHGICFSCKEQFQAELAASRPVIRIVKP